MAGEKQDLRSKQFIAKIFNCSTRRIDQLKEEGIICGVGKPSKFDLTPTIQAYIKYLSDKAYGREKKRSDAENESLKIESDARLKKSKADIAELELKELKGQLHRAEDVEAITTDHVLYFRSMLMSLPNKLAVDLAKIDNAPEVAEKIKKEVTYILEQLSNYKYDAEEYKKRVRERKKWREENDDENNELLRE